MMNNTPRRVPVKLIAALIFLVILFAVFNLSRRPLENEAQVSYNNWYANAEKEINRGAGEPVTIKLSVTDPTAPPGKREFEFKYPDAAASANPNEARDRTLRILQLIGESKLFAISTRDSEPRVVAIKIDNGTNHFETRFNLDRIADNIQAQNLLRLAEVYSATPINAAPSVNTSQL